MNNYLSTQDLEQYIRKVYSKIEPYAKMDGVYKPLDDFFDVGTPGGQDGSFCYSDEDGYHFGINERGVLRTNIITQNLDDVTYQLLRSDIFWMSFEYERKNRVEGQDNRRMMFDKMLQYWSVIGEYYVEREKKKISEALKNNPFVD